jgi:D-3-phosphoglycerate dehydrogenase
MASDNATKTDTRARGSSFTSAKPKVLKPFNTAEVKILLLENVNATAVDAFKKQGYQVSVY